ncbi:MAG: hypothetical protein ACRCYA_00350 [Cetobacterium sp.]|uniref:hypothetical protein n=1 Tax=Cetobacterium sp. TaxID=2071632 RepID=UPI003F30C696
MREIKGFERYVVTTCGRVFEKKGNSLREVKANITHKGYVRVPLANNEGKYKNLRVHKLVIETYIQLPEGVKCDVNHLDQVKTNNFIQNLEYTTKHKNNSYLCCPKKRALTFKYGWLGAVPVNENDKHYNFKGISEAKRAGFGEYEIMQSITHKKAIKGYYWFMGFDLGKMANDKYGKGNWKYTELAIQPINREVV